MAGIYIHIPYCKKKCNYCNFHSAAYMGNKAGFINALSKEIALRRDYLHEPIETIYVGGGTPSVMTAAEYKQIFTSLEQCYDLSSVKEVTIELNPEDISPELAQQYAALRFNRASIGTQAFNDKALNYLGRNHTALKNIAAITDVKNYWTTNISADIIYGIPELTNEELVQSLKTLIELKVPHISCYSLTIEEATALNKSISNGTKDAPIEDNTLTHMDIVIETLTKAGYIHYEISNFCLPGYEAIHNSNYWKQKPYIGFGPSAHSYNGLSRQWNIANNAKYINSLNEDIIPAEVETLSINDCYNEYLMTGLRTMWGIDLSYINGQFGETYATNFLNKSVILIENELMMQKDSNFVLTKNGMKISDHLISDLFFID